MAIELARVYGGELVKSPNKTLFYLLLFQNCHPTSRMFVLREEATGGHYDTAPVGLLDTEPAGRGDKIQTNCMLPIQ